MVKLDTIDIREVSRRTGLGRKAIRSRMDPRSSRFDPDFPLPIRRGRFVGWVEAEVVAYLAGRERSA